MSGGSTSVVAAMPKAEGYDVIGITLQLYDHGAAIEKKGAPLCGRTFTMPAMSPRKSASRTMCSITSRGDSANR
ncbi:MAG: hypothetical protein R3C00_00870 [Hyphomonas sp.]